MRIANRIRLVALAASVAFSSLSVFAVHSSTRASRPASHPAFQSTTRPKSAASSASAPAPAASHKIFRIEIPATKQWLDTKINVRAGAKLRVTASGKITYPPAGKNPADRVFGPDGLARSWTDLIRDYDVPDANHGALIARVGSGDSAQPFPLGLAKDFTVPVAGRLFLGLNQSEKDAASAKGAFYVTIEILDPGPNTSAAKAIGGPPDSKIAGITPSLLRSIPRRVADANGTPGDSVNILIVGTQDELVHVFLAAGWVKVDRDVQTTVIAGLIDSLQKKDYLTMPMSTLYLFERPQDFGFAHAEPVRVAMSRNHLRVWRSPYTVAGRPLWCVAATHDVGFERDERNNGVTHQIDPAIDKEREYVNATLAGTGLVSDREHVAPPDPLTGARTATGGSFHSDGRILVLVLEKTNASAGAR